MEGKEFEDYFNAIEQTESSDISDIIEITSDEDDEFIENLIEYSPKIAISNNAKLPKISFNEVDKYDFEKHAFNEVIKNAEYVHLYFDFDGISNEEQYKEVVQYLETVKTVFGNYSIGGYTNNKDISKKYGFRFIKGEQHFLSIHVVYYCSRISTKDLKEITKYSKAKGGFWRYEFIEYADYNVYKCDTRQIWRHVLSPKFYRENDPINRDNRGTILHNLKPSTQIAQIRGNEPIIEKSEWIKVFPAKECPTNKAKREREERKIQKAEAKKEKAITKARFTDVEVEEGDINLTKEELLELLSNFESHNYDIFHNINALFSSPYSKEFLIDVLTEWQQQTEHKSYDDFEAILNKYHKIEHSNRWFFILLSKLSKDARTHYSEIYKTRVDLSVNINNSDWYYEDIACKHYRFDQIPILLTKLRGVIGFAGTRWYVKTRTSEGTYMKEFTDDRLMKMLKNIKPIINNNNISMAQLVSRFSKYWQYSDAMITTEQRDDILNLWPGFKYTESEEDNFEILQPLLNHIKHIICNDNEEKYDYFMKWWANILQKITVKNGTMPIIYGEQGSGKSIAVELFCELLGKYALCNVDDLDKVFGKFNGLIGRNLVIVINEPPEVEEKQKFVGQIKSKLTQKKTIQETKGVDQIEITSWSNFIMTTNNPNPVIEEKGDRRMIYFEVNNEKIGDDQYFKELCKDFQPTQQGDYKPEYMSILLHYLRTKIDITDFNPEKLIRIINSRTNVDYNEQLERQYNDLNKIDRYIVDHADEFLRGIALDDIGNIDGYKRNGIAKKLSTNCEVNRMRVKKYKELLGDGFTCAQGEKVRVYKLKPRNQVPSLYNIIDYLKYQQNSD